MATLNTAQHFGPRTRARRDRARSPRRPRRLVRPGRPADRNWSLPAAACWRGTASSPRTIAPYGYPASARNNRAARAALSRRQISTWPPPARGVACPTPTSIGVIEKPGPHPGAGPPPALPAAGSSASILRMTSATSPSSSATAALGAVANGFVSGFGYGPPCGVASTVAHDSHHIIRGRHLEARHGARRQPASAPSAAASWCFARGRELALVELADRRP